MPFMYTKAQLEEYFKTVLNSAHGTRFDFVRTELDFALTFCRLATDAERFSDRRARNIRNAFKAYRGGMTAAKSLALTLAERAELKRLDAQVKAAFQDLSAQI